MPKPMYVWTGTAWVAVASEVESLATYATQSYADNTPGMRMVVPTSVAVGSGSGSVSTQGAVTFSGATSISLNGVFTSTYDNYKIIYNNTTASGNEALKLKYRASGTDTSTNYVSQRFYTTSTTVAGVINPSGTDEIYLNDVMTSPSDGRTSFELNIYKPYLAGVTNMHVQSTHVSGSTPYVMLSAGTQTDSTQFDGFTILSIASFGGTIRVYGYKN